MHGLRLVEQLTDPARRQELVDEVAGLMVSDSEIAVDPNAEPAPEPVRTATVRRDLQPPRPPDLDRHVANLDLDEVWSLLNPQMLYGKHLGLRGAIARLESEGDPKLARLKAVIAELEEVGRDGAMVARAVWRFFPARAESIGGAEPLERLTLFCPETGRPAAVWDVPRQSGAGGLSLADYVLDNDHVALFVTTAGAGIRERVERWKHEGEYLKSHAFAALALETAEAAAEWVHRKLRADWGFPDSPETTVKDQLQARYRGKRYSFGYPACPDLAGQRQLFTALRPEEIGVTLTEGDMMDPEASVSALVFHHPDARYFGV